MSLDTIHARRSIRAYTADPVSDAQIETLLRAAMAAPSAGNQQPWRFIVIRDAAKKQAIADIHPYAKMTASAPVAILICGDPSGGRYPAFWPQDCSAATENLLLAVQATGLGAVWCGIYPNDERVAGFRALFNLPEAVIPFALVPLGVPGEQKPPAERFTADFVHYENW
jgi:nitroreductase